MYEYVCTQPLLQNGSEEDSAVGLDISHDAGLWPRLGNAQGTKVENCRAEVKAQEDTEALEAETEAWTMEAEAVAWGEAASDFCMAHAALTSCENKITFCE